METKTVGTILELNAQVGDVLVEHDDIKNETTYTVMENCKLKVTYPTGRPHVLTKGWFWDGCKFRVVSRAVQEPKLWKDLTPEEKGALLLAHHEGKVIEYFGGVWDEVRSPGWFDDVAYRIKPEPKVESVELSGDDIRFKTLFGGHKIMFNLIDGKPDLASIKMEEIK